MQLASEYFPWVIFVIAVLDLVLWASLYFQSRKQKRRLDGFLKNVVREHSHSSDADESMWNDEQISAFIADIRDVASGPASADDALLRLLIKDESRPYLMTHGFEIGYSIARTSIEMFPLLGIIGTVVAIAAGLRTGGGTDADKVGRVVQNFGHSVWSTAIGLLAAIGFMFLNACLEPGFERLLGYANEIRGVILEAKKKLGLGAAGTREMPR
jgi:biopolymer transport protein ExbB/TolQ